jgi:hypothetical protein
MKMRMVTGSFLLIVTAMMISSSTSRASDKGRNAGPFEAMSFLAGSCWKGAFNDRPSVTDEHCFEWLYDGKFLQDKHVVRGDSIPYEGQTLFAWNAKEKKIVYWYIAVPGFYSTGYVDAKDQKIMFIDDLHAASGRRDLRSVWERTGPDAFLVHTQDHTGGNIKELWSMEMRRVSR